MTKIPMNKLTANVITLAETNELLVAINEFKLCQLEFELHQKALKKAEEALDAAITESLKHIPLKWMEGELIALPNYHKMFCYLHEDFISIPVPEEYINEGIL